MAKILSCVIGALTAVILGLIAYFNNKVKNLKSDLKDEQRENASKSTVIEVLQTAQDVYDTYKQKDKAIQKEGAENEAKAESDFNNIVNMFSDFNNGV